MSKEKTREIKGWVREYHAPWIKEGVAMPFFPEKPTDGGPLIEATLLIHEPEKTATISESEFHQMTRDFKNPHATVAFKFWLEKLFGSET